MRTSTGALCGRTLLATLCLCAIGATASAEVVTGSIEDWPESGPEIVAGDGIHGVRMRWSIAGLQEGWFYGQQGSPPEVDVAHAVGVTSIQQITDASIFEFGWVVGPLCDAECDDDGVGEFVVFRNNITGHYAVLRIDDVYVFLNHPSNFHRSWLDCTWWFQTDGSGNFADTVALQGRTWSSVKGLYR